jgi:hypothetical protein
VTIGPAKTSARKPVPPAIDTGRALAALLGAPLLALVLGTWLSAFLPFRDASSVAIGGQLVIPLWVVLTCTLPLAGSARKAWTYCLAPATVAAAMLLLRALS